MLFSNFFRSHLLGLREMKTGNVVVWFRSTRIKKDHCSTSALLTWKLRSISISWFVSLPKASQSPSNVLRSIVSTSLPFSFVRKERRNGEWCDNQLCVVEGRREKKKEATMSSVLVFVFWVYPIYLHRKDR
jgi:hypothetical protein